MSATYEQTPCGRTTRQSGFQPSRTAKTVGNAFLNWLAGIGERSAQGRAAATFQRLNALSDDELATLGLTREELIGRCFGWRGMY